MGCVIVTVELVEGEGCGWDCDCDSGACGG